MGTLRWYNRLADIYDLVNLNDLFYRGSRQRAMDQLRLSPGDVVLDLFCGTGVNFAPLSAHIGRDGQIIGADGSTEMLDQARRKAQTVTTQVQLVQADFSTKAGITEITGKARETGATKFLFTLGLTCLPDWRSFFNAVFDAAPQESRFAIMDCYSDHLTLGTRFLNWIGSGDCRHPVWEELERRGTDFNKEMYRPYVLLDSSVVVASGSKPTRMREG